MGITRIISCNLVGCGSAFVSAPSSVLLNGGVIISDDDADESGRDGSGTDDGSGDKESGEIEVKNNGVLETVRRSV